MQSSVAVIPSPVLMESLIFREKLGLSSVFTNNSVQAQCGTGARSTARCLFGAPDPLKAKELVSEVELKNAFNFGKRFNFDIVSGHPFPAAKRMKLEEKTESDEENQEGGYVWNEVYDENFMASCNKHAIKTSIVGPSRLPVSLFYAPTVVPECTRLPSQVHKSFGKEEEKFGQSKSTSTSSTSSPLRHLLVGSPELINNENNNNNNNNNNTTEPKKTLREKTKNRINRIHHDNQKKTSFSSLTKCTNRILKHAVMKRPKKTVITDFLNSRRMRNIGPKQTSKK